MSSKCIKDLGIRPEILKLLKENISGKLEVMGTEKDFLNRSLIAQRMIVRTENGTTSN